MNLIFAIKDRATDSFGQPMFMATKGAATRSFQDAINNKDQGGDLNRHSDDFDMYLVGTWNAQTGTIEPNTPELIARGKDLIIKE